MVAVGADVVSAWQGITAAGGGGYEGRLVGRLSNPDGSRYVEDLPIVACQWGWDGSSTRPLSGTVDVPAIDWSRDPAVDWRPVEMDSALTPFGRRLSVFMSVEFAGITATVPLGVGLVQTVSYQRPAELLRVTVTDLAAEFEQAITTVDFAVLAPMPLSDVIGLIVAGSGANQPTLGSIPAGTVTPRTWPRGTSCWQIIQEAVQAVDAGLRAWFNRSGHLTVGQLATDSIPAGQAPAGGLWSLATGDGGHITELESVLTRDGAVNTVAVSVEDTEVADPEYVEISGDETGMSLHGLGTLYHASGGGTKLSRPVKIKGGYDGATDTSSGTWVPRPNDDRGHMRSPAQYVAWAKTQVGNGYPNRQCLGWVSTALTGSQGWGGALARYVWENRPAGAQIWRGDTSPPIGALCVWGASPTNNAGHIGISVGGGWMISATNGAVGRQRISGFTANYLGAVEPY